jgi:hypothetical protein
MTPGPFTRPFTRHETEGPSTASANGGTEHHGDLHGGYTPSQGYPSRARPSLGDGAREGLSIRVSVDLATYQRIAQLGRTYGTTLEGAASLLLADASATGERASERYPQTLERRCVTTPAGYLEGAAAGFDPAGGKKSVELGVATPAYSLEGAPPSPVEVVEPQEVRHE